MKRRFVVSATTALLCLFSASCATTKLAVTRLAPANLEVSNIKSVGMLNFAPTQPAYTNGAMVITKIIENKLGASGFFKLKPNLGMSTEVVFHDLVAKAGTDNDVDMMIVGVVNNYGSETKREMRRHEKEEHTGRYRTENYVENGVTKTRKVEIVVKKEYFEPYVRRGAGVGFIAYLVRSGEPKSLINEQFSETKFVEAEGESKIRALPSEQLLISSLTDKLTDQFLAYIIPHEVTESVQLIGKKGAKAGYKLAKAGNWDEAITAWNGVLVANPADDVVIYDLGVAYEYRGDHAKALEYYSKALSVANKPLYAKSIQRVSGIIEQNKKLEKQMQGRKK